MNIAKMMKQAQQMQQKMQSLQSDLAGKEVEASVGGGKVTVTAIGGGDGDITAGHAPLSLLSGPPSWAASLM